jgi:phosphoserine phosphatase RsbU/P
MASSRHENGAAMLSELNRIVCDISPDNFFATLFHARLDPLRFRLRYASAGHEPALLVRADMGSFERLEATGTVLGLTYKSRYTERTLAVYPGDLLIAFTDGIADAAGRNGRLWRDSDILNVLQAHQDESASDIVAGIVSATTGAGSGDEADDRTVIAVRFTARSGVFRRSHPDRSRAA